MRILQALVNKAAVGRLFHAEPRLFTPVTPTPQEEAVRKVLRLNGDDASVSEILRGLSYALRASAHRFDDTLREEIGRISDTFLTQQAPGLTGATLAAGSLRHIHTLFPEQWPVHGVVTLAPANPYAPIDYADFRLVVRAGPMSVLAHAACNGRTLRTRLGGPEEAVMELDAVPSPSLLVRVFAPQEFPYQAVLTRLTDTAAMSALLSETDLAGLYESLPDALGKVAVVAAALAKRGIYVQQT